MTVLAVLAVLESTLLSFPCPTNTKYRETAVTVLTVLAVSAVVVVSIVMATPPKHGPPFRNHDQMFLAKCHYHCHIRI